MTSETENKTERVQLLMAPSELAAIDDWGFENRIRSRGEAIRRLCQIGLAYERHQEALSDAIRTALARQISFMENTDRLATQDYSGNVSSEVVIATIQDVLERLHDSFDPVYESVLFLSEEAGTFREQGEVASLLERARAASDTLHQKLEANQVDSLVPKDEG